MAAYFSVIVVNPEDWSDFLDGSDAIRARLVYDPTGAQAPAFDVAANATTSELFYASVAGYPADGPASITVLIDTAGASGAAHRETLHYVGRVVGGDVFRYDPRVYPVRATLF